MIHNFKEDSRQNNKDIYENNEENNQSDSGNIYLTRWIPKANIQLLFFQKSKDLDATLNIVSLPQKRTDCSEKNYRNDKRVSCDRSIYISSR